MVCWSESKDDGSQHPVGDVATGQPPHSYNPDTITQ